jgi:hypothetical protein
MPPPRTAIIEEFDDDTDLPLPSRALPNTGTHGPLLEEIFADDLGGRVEDEDDDDDDLDENFTASLHKHTPGSASHPNPILRPPGAGIRPDGAATVTDVTPYKSCVPRLLYCLHEAHPFVCLDGHVSTPFTSMRNVRTGLVNAGLREQRASGGR